MKKLVKFLGAGTSAAIADSFRLELVGLSRVVLPERDGWATWSCCFKATIAVEAVINPVLSVAVDTVYPD